MKQTTVILSAGLAMAAGAFWLTRRQAPAGGADAQRVAGMNQLNAIAAGQAAGTQAAIAQHWKELDSVFSSQPDFYV